MSGQSGNNSVKSKQADGDSSPSSSKEEWLGNVINREEDLQRMNTVVHRRKMNQMKKIIEVDCTKVNSLSGKEVAAHESSKVSSVAIWSFDEDIGRYKDRVGHVGSRLSSEELSYSVVVVLLM